MFPNPFDKRSFWFYVMFPLMAHLVLSLPVPTDPPGTGHNEQGQDAPPAPPAEPCTTC